MSREAGQPYHGRMFGLPPYLLAGHNGGPPDHAHILDGMRLCGYFLQERVFVSRGLSLPQSRAQFMALLPQAEQPAFV